MRPYFCRMKLRYRARVTKKAPLRFTSSTAEKSSALSCRASLSTVRPALLTRIWKGPKSASASLTAWATACSSDTSTFMARLFTPVSARRESVSCAATLLPA